MNEKQRKRVYNIITQLTDGDVIVSYGAYVAMFPDGINEVDDELQPHVLKEAEKYNPETII